VVPLHLISTQIAQLRSTPKVSQIMGVLNTEDYDAAIGEAIENLDSMVEM